MTENHMRQINAMQPKPKQVTQNQLHKKWVVNLSDIALTESQNQVLQLALNFALAPKRPPIPKIIASVEQSLRKIAPAEATHIRSKVVLVIRNHTPEPCALKSDEMRALKELRNHPDIVVLKADKGNVTVVMNKQAYDNQILDLLNDTTTYEPLRIDPTNKTEKTVNQFVSGLRKKEKISVQDWFKLKSWDSRAPRLYGLPKIHKTNVPLRPIVSFIESPTYGLSKKLAEISHFVGKSDRNVKNSYEFVEFLRGLIIDSNEIMVSFDVVSLFT